MLPSLKTAPGESPFVIKKCGLVLLLSGPCRQRFVVQREDGVIPAVPGLGRGSLTVITQVRLFNFSFHSIFN